MSSTQWALLLGLGVGCGMILLFHEVVGRRLRDPHLAATAARLTGTTEATADAMGEDGGAERIGRLVLRRTSGWAVLHIPHRDLALLRMSVSHYLGLRVLCGVTGLLLPSFGVVIPAMLGSAPPLMIPIGCGLVAAVALSYLPLLRVVDQAQRKRAEFRLAITAYIDLVALERAAGAGATQALEAAAQIGRSWAFQRLRDELAHARWAGVPAWDALRVVGEELRVPELTDVGNVMRMSAREGATVYDILRARAAAMRDEILSGDQARAGSRTERATAPLAVTSVVFMLILAAPVAMQIG